MLQFAAPRYRPWIYWLAVVMVAVFGTMAADVLHIKLGIPYVVSTGFFAVVLAAVFALWYSTERTLPIHTINTPRREAFYWLTVMATFALGTAGLGQRQHRDDGLDHPRRRCARGHPRGCATGSALGAQLPVSAATWSAAAASGREDLRPGRPRVRPDATIRTATSSCVPAAQRLPGPGWCGPQRCP